MRTLLVVLTGVLLIDGCAREVHSGAQGPVCADPPERSADEPLFQRARDLLTSAAWAETRIEYALAGSAPDARWVTDDATCARLARALAAGRPPNVAMPVAAVHVGNFYLVRADPLGPDWLLDTRFKVLTLFVVPS